MRLNGWCRLWIVLTASWLPLVAVGVYLTGSRSEQTARARTEAFIADYAEDSVAWDPCLVGVAGLDVHLAELAQSVSAPDVKTAAAMIARSVRESRPVFFAGLEKKVETCQSEETWRDRRLALWVALLPPALLYVLGAAVAWVRRGFQQAKKDRSLV